MADYFKGRIEIGGRVPHHLKDQLIKEIRSAHAAEGDDWGGSPFQPSTVDELKALAEENEGNIVLCDDAARYGEFDSLEEFLAKNDIGFSRHSDAHDELDAERVEFRPGWDKPRVFNSNAAGDTVVSLRELREKVFPLLKADVKSAAQAQWFAADALLALRRMTGDDITPLQDIVFEKP